MRESAATAGGSPFEFFLAAGNVPIAGVSAAVMREIDRLATTVYGPSLLQMMEHAGRSLAEVALGELVAPPSESRILVVAGPGGNGGGGVACARWLLGRIACVDLWVTDPDRLGAAAEAQLRTFRAAAGLTLGRSPKPAEYDLVVDAILGYGLVGAPTGAARAAIECVGAADRPVVALDLPSGIHPDTGEALGAHLTATATVTLHLPKRGLHSPAAGRLLLVDLGIPPRASREAGATPPPPGAPFVAQLRRSDRHGAFAGTE